MATGIFSTTRVAGEGVAIAIVSTLLTWLIEAHLPENLSVHRLATAQHLAMGDIGSAARQASLDAHALIHVYDDAFRCLIYFLIIITVACALLVSWLLRETLRPVQVDLTSCETGHRPR